MMSRSLLACPSGSSRTHYLLPNAYRRQPGHWLSSVRPGERMSFIAENTDRFANLKSTLDTAARRVFGLGIVVASLVVAACSKPVPQRPPAEVTVAPALGK